MAVEFVRRTWLMWLALLVLRVVVGLHFYAEGVDKLRSGDFSARGFLTAAKGPWAPWFRSWVNDPDAALLLGVTRTTDAEGRQSIGVNGELTLAIWDDFVDRAAAHFDWSAATADQAQTVLKHYADHYRAWLQAHESELMVHFQTADRTMGFARDGDNRQQVVQEVDSLRDQLDAIKAERQQKVASWSSEVEMMWTAFEEEINQLSTADAGSASGASRRHLTIHRPFDQSGSALRWIDRIVPWFDLIVGGLLIIGFLTPWASLAGASFLIAVMATQPPWVPGSTSVAYQAVECAALFVLAFSGAGRNIGVDVLFGKRRGASNNRGEPERRSGRA